MENQRLGGDQQSNKVMCHENTRGAIFLKTCLEGVSEGSWTELWLSTALKNCSLGSGLIKRYDRIRITLWSIWNFSTLHIDGSRGLPQPRTRSKKHFLMSQFKNCTLSYIEPFCTYSMSWKRCWPSWRGSPPSQCRCLRPHCTPAWCHRLRSPEQKRWEGESKMEGTEVDKRSKEASDLKVLVASKFCRLGLSVHLPKDPIENSDVTPSKRPCHTQQSRCCLQQPGWLSTQPQNTHESHTTGH